VIDQSSAGGGKIVFRAEQGRRRLNIDLRFGHNDFWRLDLLFKSALDAILKGVKRLYGLPYTFQRGFNIGLGRGCMQGETRGVLRPRGAIAAVLVRRGVRECHQRKDE
jgi:hypothetical protein